MSCVTISKCGLPLLALFGDHLLQFFQIRRQFGTIFVGNGFIYGLHEVHHDVSIVARMRWDLFISILNKFTVLLDKLIYADRLRPLFSNFSISKFLTKRGNERILFNSVSSFKDGIFGKMSSCSMSSLLAVVGSMAFGLRNLFE